MLAELAGAAEGRLGGFGEGAVERDANPRYYDLIKAFGELTGVPVLINTSFNEREPIVARPEDRLPIRPNVLQVAAPPPVLTPGPAGPARVDP